MKSRFLPVLAVSLLSIACAAETGQEDADAAAEAAPPAMSAEMSADEAAIDQIRMDYVQHYNMHHPDVVAAMYDDSATWLSSDGGVYEGREAILATLQTDMAGSPTLDLSGRDIMVFGDFAVAIGDYTIETTPPGASQMTLAGHYMTGFERENGEWKIIGVITNFNAPPPEGVAAPEQPDMEAPPEDGTMTDLITAYETHFNLGHPDMVADLFTEDATVAFGNLPLGEGRAAVSSAIQARLALGDSPQIDIHDVYTMELGDGYAVDSGWSEITTASGTVQTGKYITLARQQADGSWKIHWMVSNVDPTN